VRGVAGQGPAQRAGLQAGDVITAVDGADVTALGLSGVTYAVVDRPPGTRLPLTVQRGDQTLTLTVELGAP
jgi:S1-C subfamily serine protease